MNLAILSRAPKSYSTVRMRTAAQVLEANDRLLCFGRLEAMRGLIPERRKRRVKVRPLPDELHLDDPTPDNG